MADYSIEHKSGRVIVHGAVPVDEMATLTKLWSKQGYDTFAVGVASSLGATMAICRKDDLEKWQAEVEAAAAREAKGDVEKEWFRGHETGISSKTIFSVLASGPTRLAAEAALSSHWGGDVPHDPSDFGRCYRLLEKFPEWKDRLGEVAAKYPKYGPMVREWDQLTILWKQEAPTGRCPKLFDLIQKLEDEGRAIVNREKKSV